MMALDSFSPFSYLSGVDLAAKGGSALQPGGALSTRPASTGYVPYADPYATYGERGEHLFFRRLNPAFAQQPQTPAQGALTQYGGAFTPLPSYDGGGGGGEAGMGSPSSSDGYDSFGDAVGALGDKALDGLSSLAPSISETGMVDTGIVGPVASFASPVVGGIVSGFETGYNTSVAEAMADEAFGKIGFDVDTDMDSTARGAVTGAFSAALGDTLGSMAAGAFGLGPATSADVDSAVNDAAAAGLASTPSSQIGPPGFNATPSFAPSLQALSHQTTPIKEAMKSALGLNQPAPNQGLGPNATPDGAVFGTGTTEDGVAAYSGIATAMAHAALAKQMGVPLASPKTLDAKINDTISKSQEEADRENDTNPNFGTPADPAGTPSKGGDGGASGPGDGMGEGGAANSASGGGFGQAGPAGDVGDGDSPGAAASGQGGDGGGHGDGPGGGGTFICTAAFDNGFVPAQDFRRIKVYGARLRRDDPHMMRFYDWLGPKLAAKVGAGGVMDDVARFLVGYYRATQGGAPLTGGQRLFRPISQHILRPIYRSIGWLMSKA